MVKTYVPRGIYLLQSLVIKVPPSLYRSYKPSLKTSKLLETITVTNPQSLGEINRANGKNWTQKEQTLITGD